MPPPPRENGATLFASRRDAEKSNELGGRASVPASRRMPPPPRKWGNPFFCLAQRRRDAEKFVATGAAHAKPTKFFGQD